MPNDSVDRDSQESSACYPWRTFDTLSDGDSTFNHRITRTDTEASFRISARPVGLAVRGAYTLALHSREIRLEPPFALLRYTLGGDRPSQTGNRPLFELLTREG